MVKLNQQGKQGQGPPTVLRTKQKLSVSFFKFSCWEQASRRKARSDAFSRQARKRQR